MGDSVEMEKPLDPPPNDDAVNTNNNDNNGGGGAEPWDTVFNKNSNVEEKYLSIKIDFKKKDRLSTGSNYDVWTIRMTGFLKEANLWMYVDGSHPRP